MATAYATDSGRLIKVSGQLVTEECCRCGIVFAMPVEFKEQRLGDKASFYCPGGHGQHYTTNEADRLRQQLENERRALSTTQDLLNGERRSHAATKGQLTKTLNRIHEGVCPECNRTFKQLSRHMRSRHKGADEAQKLAAEMRGGA